VTATIHSRSLTETRRLGERLGRVLAAGDVVALTGTLGAGKTAFVQGLARGLAVTSARVASPTFTIVNEHAGRVPLYHVDLYRLEHPEELAEIGLSEYFGRGGVTVVEWFDRFPDEQPAERLEVRIEITGPRERQLHVTARGTWAAERLRSWIGPTRGS
jgi:tRNA threonylcarbamoyladenosine biosynthesis protein TsaE